jgi:hypothetical protein
MLAHAKPYIGANMHGFDNRIMKDQHTVCNNVQFCPPHNLLPQRETESKHPPL